MTTRTRPCGSAVALAVLLLAGCGNTAPAPTEAPRAPRTAPAPPAPDPAPDGRPEAVEFARVFLTVADKGNPDLAKLTPAFKQLIGPPSTESDKARGYSEWVAEQWLKEALTGKIKTVVMVANTVNPDTVIVTAADSAQGQPGQAVLRLWKSGSGYMIDWVHVAPQKDRYHLGGSGDKLGSSFTANAFLDTLVTGQTTLTQSLLTPAAKANLAPPLNDPLGFNQAMLGVKLAGFRGKATEWKASGSETTVTGQLLEPGGTARAFTLTLMKGTRVNEWLVDAFDVK